MAQEARRGLEAEQVARGRRVAVQVCLAFDDADSVKRIAASVAHPNIVQVIDHGTEGAPWIAFEQPDRGGRTRAGRGLRDRDPGRREVGDDPHRLFAGATFVEVLDAHVQAPVPQAGARRRGLSLELDRVLERVLARKPALRWKSAGDFAAALSGVRGVTRAGALAELRAPAPAPPCAALSGAGGAGPRAAQLAREALRRARP